MQSTQVPTLPSTLRKAAKVRTTPVSPLLQTPLVMMARAVRVQTTTVSMNTSRMPYIPW